MAKERIDWIDLAKGIGIYLVALGHCCLWFKIKSIWLIQNMLSAFHMPLFFILLGFTTKASTTTPIRSHIVRTSKLLKKYFVFCIFSIISDVIIYFGYYNNIHGLFNQYSNPYNWIRTILFMRDAIFGKLWFIPAIIVVELILYILLHIFKQLHRVLIFSSLVCMIDLLYAKFINIAVPFELELACLGLIFVVLGYALKYYWKEKKKQYPVWGFWEICVLGVVFIASIFLTEKLFLCGAVGFAQLQLGNPILFMVNALLGSLFIILLSIKLNKFKFINNWGKYSLYIYAIHYMFIQLARILLKNINIDNKVIGTIALIIISAVIVEITYRICLWVMMIIKNWESIVVKMSFSNSKSLLKKFDWRKKW